MERSGIKLFVCTSITHAVGRPERIARLRGLIETIDRTAERHGAVTWCALREENWKGEENPAIYVPRDIRWSRECDGAIIIPEDSYGVRIEEGWLSILQKPMLRLHEGAVVHRSDIERNLHHATHVLDRAFHTLVEVEKAVNEFIEFLHGQK